MHLSSSRRLFCAGCVLGLAAAALPARSQSMPEKAAKIERLMHDDGYNYNNTKSPGVWIINFTGKHMSEIKVIVAISDQADSDLMVIFVTVAPKARLPVTTDFMRKLLQENHELDRVKVGYDGDGDLFVREDAALRAVDDVEMKAIVDQVEKSSDEVYGVVAPDLQ